ncbi:unnamed protein product [Closterium sp. NIES-54]
MAEASAQGAEGMGEKRPGGATGSGEAHEEPCLGEKEETKEKGEGLQIGETAAATRAGRNSDRPYCRSASWQGFEEDVAFTRWRYTMLPKVEVPERFSGEVRCGPSLKNYLMQLENLRARWERDRLDAGEFFTGLANTLTGEAETYYRICRRELLDWAAQAPAGKRDPTRRFLEMLREQFPLQTPERVVEFRGFKRKSGESLLAYFGRLVELAEDMNCVDQGRLVSKFLNGLNYALQRDVQLKIFEMGAAATLGVAYETAKRVETGRLRELHLDVGVFHKPIVLLELFAGICTGLAAVLKAGLRVEKYIYVENDEVVNCMAWHHVKKLEDRYPSQLHAGVVEKGAEWDAAQNGSRAHRPRRYWQNVIPEAAVLYELSMMERPRARLVQDILEPARIPAPVRYPDHEMQYPCNVVGKPRQAWPTLVAHDQAKGFKIEGAREGPGMVYDSLKGVWEEPTALERELAMGFMAGATASGDVTEQQRKRALGNAMDLNALHWLVRNLQRHLEKKRLERRRDHAARVNPRTERDDRKQWGAERFLELLEEEAREERQKGVPVERRTRSYAEGDEAPGRYPDQDEEEEDVEEGGEPEMDWDSEEREDPTDAWIPDPDEVFLGPRRAY